MGMNMVSKGCEAAVREVQKRFRQARLVALSGNMCTDKKSSAQNWVEGRGKSIVVSSATHIELFTIHLHLLLSNVARLSMCVFRCWREQDRRLRRHVASLQMAVRSVCLR